MKKENYKIVEIDKIEEIGAFNDEYVYDLEMDDESHSFIANNILVHNTDSLFVTFKPAIDHCTWKNLIFNKEYLDSIDKKFIILSHYNIQTNNPNYLALYL